MVFFTIFKLNKCHQIAQSMTNGLCTERNLPKLLFELLNKQIYQCMYPDSEMKKFFELAD